MSNTITIELCDDDRARIDRLTAALEALQPPRVSTIFPIGDPEADALAAQLILMRERGTTPAEPPQEPAETTEEPAAPVIPPREEEPTEATEPSVTVGMIQQKVTTIAAAKAGKYKARVREIIHVYAKKVSDLPADKLAEVWEKLTELEQLTEREGSQG